MTDLRQHLSRLGLAQYTEKFIEEGFETWDTILDVTESDLYGHPKGLSLSLANRLFSDALGVKLGHRRVSHIRGIIPEGNMGLGRRRLANLRLGVAKRDSIHTWHKRRALELDIKDRLDRGSSLWCGG